MGIKSLRLAELRSLSDEQIEARVADFAANRDSPVNGEIDVLDERIAAFETRYEMSSGAMREKLSKRELEETADLCAWSMLVNLRDKLVSAKAS